MPGPADFDRCLRRPPLFRHGAFAFHLVLIDTPQGGLVAWRLGLVIPKRHETSAVARNTIKRRWRDAFRRGRAAWATEFGSADLVVRLQSPVVPRSKRAKGAPVIRGPRARLAFDAPGLMATVVERLRARGRP